MFRSTGAQDQIIRNVDQSKELDIILGIVKCHWKFQSEERYSWIYLLNGEYIVKKRQNKHREIIQQFNLEKTDNDMN